MCSKEFNFAKRAVYHEALNTFLDKFRGAILGSAERDAKAHVISLYCTLATQRLTRLQNQLRENAEKRESVHFTEAVMLLIDDQIIAMQIKAYADAITLLTDVRDIARKSPDLDILSCVDEKLAESQKLYDEPTVE